MYNRNRDPRIQAGSNNSNNYDRHDRQFFPTVSHAPMVPRLYLPASSPAVVRQSTSPPRKNQNDQQTNELRKTYDKQVSDLRSTYDQQMNALRLKLNEKENKIRELEASELASKKEIQEAKDNVFKMRDAHTRLRNEADKAKSDLSSISSEKNRLILAITEEGERHKKTQSKYNALNIQYGNLFKENGAMKEELNKLKQMLEDATKERNSAKEDTKDAATEPMETAEPIEIVKPSPKRRGRTSKKNDKEEIHEDETMEVIEPSPKRGKSSGVNVKKNVEEDTKDVDETMETTEPIETVKPSPKRRGRTSGKTASATKNDKEGIQDDETVEAIDPSPKRRGRPPKKNVEQDNVASAARPSRIAKELGSKKTASMLQTPLRRSTRGKSVAPAETSTINNDESEEEKPRPPKRSRTTKK
uniref:Uncharacterized protein n=1 Tax=Panagrolaimus sp. ES5 TaxID=591445 RepID=A0AC34FCA4_9BILA